MAFTPEVVNRITEAASHQLIPHLLGQDPEFFNTGGVAVPVPKQFTLTLRLGI